MFKGRTPIDVMMILFTLVVSISILAAGATIALIKIRDPTVDTSQSVDAISQVITAIVGALLGLMAGRSEPPQKPPQ